MRANSKVEHVKSKRSRPKQLMSIIVMFKPDDWSVWFWDSALQGTVGTAVAVLVAALVLRGTIRHERQAMEKTLAHERHLAWQSGVDEAVAMVVADVLPLELERDPEERRARARDVAAKA